MRPPNGVCYATCTRHGGRDGAPAARDLGFGILSQEPMYGQLTVGKPLHIISRVKGDKLASEMFVSIDTAKNQPDIHRKKQLTWHRSHGTLVEIELEGHYQKGPHSVEAYLKQTAIANPHVAITYRDPQGEEIHFSRSTKELPPRPKEIKPHPYGIELGRLIQMLNNTASSTLLRFLVDELSRVGRMFVWVNPQFLVRHAGFAQQKESSSPMASQLGSAHRFIRRGGYGQDGSPASGANSLLLPQEPEHRNI